MFAIVGAIAELERNIIRERILAGLEHARVKGTKSGGAIGRPPAIFDRAQLIKRRAAGQSWREIATALGVGVATVHRAFEASVPKPLSTQHSAGDERQRFATA
jgi:DNA invertase Pin-like site-specific DNA recombinase